MDLQKNYYERESRNAEQNKWRTLIIRLSDIMLGISLMLLLLPLFLYIYILILRKEGRPVFHQEVSRGRKNRSFTMWKFRTLSNPSRLITAFPPYRHPEGWRENTSKTITTTGRCLKKYKLEKLPLLINIIKGDISFAEGKYFRRT